MSKFIDLTAYGDGEDVILFIKSSIGDIVVNDFGDYIILTLYVDGTDYSFKFKDIEQAEKFYKHILKELENE